MSIAGLLVNGFAPCDMPSRACSLSLDIPITVTIALFMSARFPLRRESNAHFSRSGHPIVTVCRHCIASLNTEKVDSADFPRFSANLQRCNIRDLPSSPLPHRQSRHSNAQLGEPPTPLPAPPPCPRTSPRDALRPRLARLGDAPSAHTAHPFAARGPSPMRTIVSPQSAPAR